MCVSQSVRVCHVHWTVKQREAHTQTLAQTQMYTGRCCSGYSHLSEHEWIVTERCPPQGRLSPTLYLHSVKISLLFNHAFAGRFHTLKLRHQAFSAVRGSIHFDYFIILVQPQPFSLASSIIEHCAAPALIIHLALLLNFLPLVDLPTNIFTYWLYSATKVQARTHLRNVKFWGHAQLTNELCAGRMQTC